MLVLALFLVLVLVALSVSVPVQANGLAPQEFWPLEAYLKQHPEEAARMRRFSEGVRRCTTPLTAPPDKPVRIAIVYPGLQASDYWRRSVVSFEARLQEAAIPYKIERFFSRPGVDLALQEQQLAQAIAADPDYLVFTLDALRHRLLIERLLARKRPKLILQNITTPVKAWGERQPFLYVGFDHQAGTRLLAAYYREKTGGMGKYIVLHFTRGYVSAMRGDTFIAALAAEPGLSLVGSYYIGPDQDKARRATLDALARHPDLTFIYASSTDIALGASAALAEAGRQGDIRLNGWGGGSAELAVLADGGLDVTVMRMNDDNGVAMADAIKLDLEGRAEDKPTVFSGDFRVIDHRSSPAEIAAARRWAFRYSDASRDASRDASGDAPTEERPGGECE